MFTKDLLNNKNINDLTAICNTYKIKYSKKAEHSAIIENILDFINLGQLAAEKLYYILVKNNSNPELLNKLVTANLPPKDHGDLNVLKTNQLKDILDYYGVSKTGNKVDLINKINEIFITGSKIQTKLVKFYVKLLIQYNKYLKDINQIYTDYECLKQFISKKDTQNNTNKAGFIYCIKLESGCVKIGTSTKNTFEKLCKYFEKRLNIEKLDNSNIKVVQCLATELKSKCNLICKKYLNFKQDKLYKLDFAEVDLTN